MSKFQNPYEISTYGSRLRAYCTIASVLLIVLLCIEAAFGVLEPDKARWIKITIAYFVVIWAVAFFNLVIVVVLFLTSRHFKPDALRLLIDGLVSISLCILGFALAYRIGGIVGPDGVYTDRILDFVYFSAVTFSTLGFGDFQPSERMRLLAAFQALLGNLHLGVIVGAMFFATQKSLSRHRKEGRIFLRSRRRIRRSWRKASRR